MSSEIPTNDDQVEIKMETTSVDDNAEQETVVGKIPPLESPLGDQLQQYGNIASEYINKLPSYFSDFFKNYKGLLITLGSIVAVFAGFKLIIALLGAINDIPLLALILELIGLAYVIWFVYRYLLSTANRQELAAEVKSIKEQFLGS
jgi:hypothetical protein